MLKWLWKKAFEAIKEEMLDWIESKEGEEFIAEFSDSIVDRQIARIRSSAGGVVHNPAQGGNNTLIGGILQALLPNLLGKVLNSSSQNVLSENPYGKA